MRQGSRDNVECGVRSDVELSEVGDVASSYRVVVVHGNEGPFYLTCVT